MSAALGAPPGSIRCRIIYGRSCDSDGRLRRAALACRHAYRPSCRNHLSCSSCSSCWSYLNRLNRLNRLSHRAGRCSCRHSCGSGDRLRRAALACRHGCCFPSCCRYRFRLACHFDGHRCLGCWMSFACSSSRFKKTWHSAKTVPLCTANAGLPQLYWGTVPAAVR